MSPPYPSPRVTVAGGGIAGMTAALRLAQRGYQVTLYESKPWLGGNLGSHQDDETGPYHDVFPHMFSNFYVNFWHIVEHDLGLKRDASPESDFAPRDSVRNLSLTGGSHELKNAATLNPLPLLQDMFNGVSGLSPLDMYLYLYSLLDLIVARFDDRGRLGLSLNGFVRSRPTCTEPVALLHDSIVMFIWSVHAAGTSAASYKSFYRHAFGNVQPLLWLLKGSLAEKIVQPLERKLLALGCTVHKNTALHQVVVDSGRVSALALRRAEFDWARHQVVVTDEVVDAAPFDHLVLAVSPEMLGQIADRGDVPRQTLAAALPRLSHAGKRLRSSPIAVLDLYFTRKIPGLPRESVSVLDSDCYFSFVDLSQLWPEIEREGITVLSLSASDYWALPSDDDDINAHHLVCELARYISGFNPGQAWGDPQADIDWTRTHFHSNEDDVIFLNQVGSWAYRPETHHPEVQNLYFAGDFCRNHIDMATVEAAVTSGINAAAALQARAPLGEPIATLHPPVWPHAALALLKLTLAPAAYGAKACLMWRDVAAKLGNGSQWQDLPHDLTTLMGLPMACCSDVVETLGSVWAELGDDLRRLSRPAAAPD